VTACDMPTSVSGATHRHPEFSTGHRDAAPRRHLASGGDRIADEFASYSM